MPPLTPDLIWSSLHQVKDPEIPVLSVVDLGDGVQVSFEDLP